jgi:hypothetical protein
MKNIRLWKNIVTSSSMSGVALTLGALSFEESRVRSHVFRAGICLGRSDDGDKACLRLGRRSLLLAAKSFARETDWGASE